MLNIKDPKTTISGLVASVALMAKAFGINIPDEVIIGISSAAVFLLGLFAKDK